MNQDNKINSLLSSSERVQLHLHYLDHFLRVEENEESHSERGVKYFLALAAATLTLLTALYKFEMDNENLSILLSFSLVILTTLGLLVFARIVWSDRKIKQQRQFWDISYQEIKKIELSIDYYEKRLKEMDDKKIIVPFRNIKGTLTQIMGLTEGLLITGLFYVLGNILKWQSFKTIGILLLIFILSLSTLYGYAFYIKRGVYKKQLDKSISA